MGARGLAIGAANRSEGRLAAICLGLALGYAAALLLMVWRHSLVLDVHGQPMVTDFIAPWSAGKLALAGQAARAYDPAAQHAAEVAALGHGFNGQLGWPYPPAFFFVVELLALAPFAVSFTAWVAVTGGLYGAAVAKAARRPVMALVVFAAPWALACAMVGQNGFLTGALLALALASLEERPALSGLIFGLLTYKPQFGLLIPIALVMGGHWRAIGWAVVATVAVTALAALAFGPATVTGFLHALPRTTDNLVTHGGVGWSKLQSVYGLVRCLGGANALAWTAQGVVSLAAVAAIAVLWRGRAPFALKAAALACAAILATPYVFAYDLPVLGVALAFLRRHRPFDAADYAGLALAGVALAPILVLPLPVGLGASVVVVAMVARAAIRPAWRS